ncbi:MAG: DUF3137 domain-containing protein [Phycisphaerales bacterium]|nr:DUF3137 domain-containing protein [Phycisphaerales bacterium]
MPETDTPPNVDRPATGADNLEATMAHEQSLIDTRFSKELLIMGLLPGLLATGVIFAILMQYLSHVLIWWVALLIAIPVGLLCGMAIVKGGAKKRLRLERWCAQHGWQYKEHSSHPLTDAGFINPKAASGSALLNMGARPRDHRFKVIDGRHVCFTFFEIQRSKDSWWPCTRVVLETPVADQGTVQIAHHTFGDHHMPHTHGLKAVDFELADFNKSWTVLSDNPKLASDLVTQELMEHLLTLNGRYHFELHNGLLLFVIIDARPATPEHALPTLEHFCKAAPPDLLPLITFLS